MGTSFSLRKKFVSITLEHEDGNSHPYVIEEMSAKARDEWIQANQERFKQDQEGKATLANGVGMQTTLLAQCLRNQTTKELVSAAAIDEYPSATQTALCQIAMEVNGLTPESSKKMVDEAKKE